MVIVWLFMLTQNQILLPRFSTIYWEFGSGLLLGTSCRAQDSDDRIVYTGQ